jgi:hypothetical protein
MAPVLREGDSVLIQYGNDGVVVGDVVVLQDGDAFVVQRVLRVDRRDGRDQFLVKADQYTSFHAPVARGQILGRVIEIRGSNGRIRLDSALWRTLNYVLALRSYVSGRRRASATPFWNAVNGLFRLRSKVVPAGLSISLLPCRLVCRAHTMQSHSHLHTPRKKTEE